jgi:hypothetical protein
MAHANDIGRGLFQDGGGMNAESKMEGSSPGDARCDHCGGPDAHPLGERSLCAECFQLAGSACSGGGIGSSPTTTFGQPLDHGASASPGC